MDVAARVLTDIRRGLLDIGYRDPLVLAEYAFADLLGDTPSVRRIDLAAFAQDPPSYRNACFGVVTSVSQEPLPLTVYRALGAPQLLAIRPEQRVVERWKMRAEAEPELAEHIPAHSIREHIVSNRVWWQPDAVMRGKSIGAEPVPDQLDFYDVGLLPAIDREVSAKLDTMLRGLLERCVAEFRRQHGRPLRQAEMQGLFRLVFRLLAAKLLVDRGREPDWRSEHALAVIAAVGNRYVRAAADEPVLHDIPVAEQAWSYMQESLHLQNLSVEALAYVYENTLVNRNTRRELGTHATAPELAEYIVRQLPFEQLAPDDRTVFEPFCGHGPFLIAALSRLKELLPSDLSVTARHRYLVRTLRGMELDAFAREVARYSLMLADYPNGNGWRLDADDVFTSDAFVRRLREARIVLCNPPYGDFSSPPSTNAHARKEVEAVRRILTHPPDLLGLVLPRKFVDGQSFRFAREQLNKVYDAVSVIVLEKGRFSHADVETAVVLAAGQSNSSSALRISSYVADNDYERFVRTNMPTWQVRVTDRRDEAGEAFVLWNTPLRQVWEELSAFPRLASCTLQMARGIEYNQSLRAQWSKFISESPRAGFAAGLVTATDFESYLLPKPVYLCVDQHAMRGGAYRLQWDKPKVIVPAHRISRGPWATAAAVDRQGLVCYQTFHGIWPISDWPIEVVTAVLCGPLASAFIDSHSATRRDVMKHVLSSIPMPLLSKDERDNIVTLVQRYEQARAQMPSAGDRNRATLECRRLMLEIDAAVLTGYRLAPRLERLVLDKFAGVRRPTAVSFTGFYPPDFHAAIPLRLLIAPAFEAASAQRTLERLTPLTDPLPAQALADIGINT